MTVDQIASAMGWPFTIIYICLIIGALYFLFISIPKTLKTKYWPKVSGEIVRSEIQEDKTPTSNGGHTPVYSPSIKYKYSVNGKTYTSKKIKWVDYRSSNKKSHQNVIDKYPIGNKVAVFYNPEKPNLAILEPGIGFGNIVVMLFLFCSIGSMSFVLTAKL